MAIAGRVAIVPKGDWSADATYKRLDAVTHNNTLYFAKKDVPAGTETSNTEYWSKSVVGGAVTVDDTLSSTSTNPVQNKVVTSNLTNLKYGEVAGGKNLFNGKYIKELISIGTDYTNRNLYDEFSSVNDITGLKYVMFGGYFRKGKYTLSYSNDAWFSFNRVAIAGTACITLSKQIRKTYTWEQTQDGYTYFSIEADDSETGTTDVPFSITPDIQIEEGTQATSYEPYIPSVKMLAEENAQQSTETMDIKMLGWAVPRECPIQNEVNGNQFIQKVGRVDLGSLNWRDDTANYKRFYSIVDFKFGSPNRRCKCYLFGYDAKYNDESLDLSWNKVIYCGYLGDGTNRVFVHLTSYTDANAFKQAMQGQYLYYEVATPINKTIDGNEIGENKLDKDNVVNNQTTTEEGFALDARQANPNVEGSLGAQIKAVNSSLNSKKIPSFGIENIFTGTPFCVTTNGEVINTTTNWAPDNGGYQVDITYPKGSNVSLTVYLTLPANSIAIINVNTLNHENIKVSGPCIFYNFANEPAEKDLSLSFTGRSTEQVSGTIRYMPLVIHLG